MRLIKDKLPILLALLFAFMLVVPTSALALEWWDKGAEGVETKSGDEVGSDTTMWNTNVDFDLLKPSSYLTAGGRGIFSLFASGTMLLANVADGVMEYIGIENAFLEPYGNDGAYADIYKICSEIGSKVVAPMAVGFLGIALLAELISFTKDTAVNRGGADLLGSYLFIIVKYALMSTIIANVDLIMGGIYSIVAYIGQFMVKLTDTQVVNLGMAESYQEVLKSVTFGSLGAVPIVCGFALITLGVTCMVYIYIQVLAITRMFEVYLRTAFAGFALVMVCNKSTKESGMRYFKKYVSCCVQALVMILTISVGSVLMMMGASGMADAVGAEGVGGFLMKSIASMVGILVLQSLVKQSRDFADSIVGVN
jgi:hypothetical protein